MKLLRLLPALFLALALLWGQQPALAKRPDDSAAVASCARLYTGLPLRINYLPAGPRLFLPALESGTRNLDSIEDLRVGSYNVLNLLENKGELVVNPRTGVRELVAPAGEKFAQQLDGLAATIRRADPDVLFLQEVESIPALQLLARDRLSDKYRLLLVEGNDGAGINIAVLVKKDLPLDIEMQSYRNQMMRNQRRGGNEELTFSRDLPVVKLKQPGKDEPLAVFMGTHFRSQMDSARDPRGAYKRGEQARAAAQIYQELRRGNKDPPVVLLGDFNSDVPNSAEFAPLWRAGFRDSFDIAARPPADRVTHTFHPRDGPTSFSQLDAVVVAEGKAKGIVKSGEVIPYLDARGNPLPAPRTHAEREANPSDHRMVSVVLDFRKILQSLKQ